MSGTLFVVATPIGNLEDLTPRARQTLASVDLVAAEDTRHTMRLLSNIGAKPTLLALHDHNEERAVRWSAMRAHRWSVIPGSGWCAPPMSMTSW
jgi:16S rRNA (cytidine1402-2'-O)-methyltransferase